MRTIGGGFVAFLLAGCATAGTVVEHPALAMSNGTPLAVSLIVNGTAIRVVEPGVAAPLIDPATLPDLPWAVEARSPSGRLLTSLHVQSGQVRTNVDASGYGISDGAFAIADLSCGRIEIWGATSSRPGRRRPVRAVIPVTARPDDAVGHDSGAPETPAPETRAPLLRLTDAHDKRTPGARVHQEAVREEGRPAAA